MFPGNPTQHHPPARDTENEAKAAGMFSDTLSIVKGTNSTRQNTFTPEFVSVQVRGHEWGRKDKKKTERKGEEEGEKEKEREGGENKLPVLATSHIIG